MLVYVHMLEAFVRHLLPEGAPVTFFVYEDKRILSSLEFVEMRDIKIGVDWNSGLITSQYYWDRTLLPAHSLRASVLADVGNELERDRSPGSSVRATAGSDSTA